MLIFYTNKTGEYFPETALIEYYENSRSHRCGPSVLGWLTLDPPATRAKNLWRTRVKITFFYEYEPPVKFQISN